MSSRNRIPPALEPYLRLPPEASQILLTSTLGCSVDWVTARLVGRLLAHDDAPTPGGGEALAPGSAKRETAVVLASWLRNEAFWKNEVRRCCGLDTTQHASTGRYTFHSSLSASPPPSLPDLEHTLAAAVTRAAASPSSPDARPRAVTLILDHPDALLALAPHTTAAAADDLTAMLLRLRAHPHTHAVVLACAADLPLVAAAAAGPDAGGGAAAATPMEAAGAAFVVQAAHGARFVLGVRELETGAARDVSGVVRVVRGGGCYDEEDGEGGEVKEMEALYLVQRDGGAKVFERGAA